MFIVNPFHRRESSVRSYCLSFPAVFDKAKDAFLYDTDGKRYIDFFCGAGTMNYGHNNEVMKRAILDYIEQDGIVHGLDMMTAAKFHFLERFESVILEPRRLDYKMQFVAPSGANAVEAALKLARMVTKRSNVIAFTNAYHGLSAGALSVTGNAFYRNEAFINRLNVSFMPFDGYFGGEVNTIEYLRKFLDDDGSGLDLPAAVILETIQAEGGVRIAGETWLRDLEMLCREYRILMIVDDIQVGNGRAGSFFSFERAGIHPDMVAFSKAVSGFGLPMSLLFLKPELDQWKPGEHTGTFRGDNLAFVAATEALRYWETEAFAESIRHKSRILEERLWDFQERYTDLNPQVRGRGMIYGLEISDPALTQAIAREAFQRGLLIELCGAKHNVLKFLPPLVIEDSVLEEGLEILDQSIQAVMKGILCLEK